MQMYPDYSPATAFRTLDRYSEGIIKQKQLRDFYHMLGSFPSDMDLTAIIRRIDTDGDGCLNFSEFTDFFSTQVNEEAALLARPSKQLQPPSSRSKKRRIKSAARHRTDLNPTKQLTKVNANLERLKSAIKPARKQH